MRFIVQTDPKQLFNLSTATNFCFFGYDAMMYIARALQQFDQNYGLISYFEASSNYSTDGYNNLSFKTHFVNIKKKNALHKFCKGDVSVL